MILTPYICPVNTKILSDSSRFLNWQSAKIFDTLSIWDSILEITLVRHAKSSANEELDKIGWRSEWAYLVEEWIQQARLLWERLKKEWTYFDWMVCSTALRTRQTADEVCSIIWFDTNRIEYCEKLIELSHWDWEWKDRNTLRTPEVLKRMDDETWDYRSPGWESQREVEDRMREIILESAIKYYEKWKIKKICAVTHWLSSKCLIRRLLNLNPLFTRKLKMDNTGITKIIFDWTNFYLSTINDNRHLLS